MIIAVPTNDRKTIAKRTGRSAEFAFFTVENGKVTDVRFEKNAHEHHDHDDYEPNHRKVQGYGQGHGTGKGRGMGLGLGRGHGRHHHDHEHDHHHHEHDHEHEHGDHGHDEVVEQLKDVDILLVRAVGKYMRKDLENGKIPFKTVTKENDIFKIVENYIQENASS